MKQILTFVMEGVQEVGGQLNLMRSHVVNLAESKADNTPSPPKKRWKVVKMASHEGRFPEGRNEMMDGLLSMLTAKKENTTLETEMSDDDLIEDTIDAADFQDKMGVELQKFSESLCLLVADVGLLKTCTEDKSIKFGGLGLRTLQECHSWISANFKNPRYGLMMDPLLRCRRR